MPEKTYCENSAKADIYLNLPNGKERLIKSLAPPVKITTGASALRRQEWIIKYKNESGIQIFKSEKVFDKVTFSEEKFTDFATSWRRGYQSQDELIWTVVRRNYADDGTYHDKTTYQTSYKKDYTEGYSFSVDYRPHYMKEGGNFDRINNCYVIEDNEKVLYMAEETGKESVRVECVNCPDGLCAVRGRDDVFCLDCEKVKGSLDRMSSALDKLLN